MTLGATWKQKESDEMSLMTAGLISEWFWFIPVLFEAIFIQLSRELKLLRWFLSHFGFFAVHKSFESMF